MSTSPHAPGPFHVERPYGEPGICVVAADTSIVAKVYENHADKAGCKADAHAKLLAAAPELLAALEALKEWGCTYTGPRDANSPHALLIAAHHAIAKARGEYVPTDEDLARKADEECDYYHGTTTSNPGREDFCRGT